MLYIRMAGEAMPQHEDLELEVYRLQLKNVDWYVDKMRKENYIKRFGFPIAPESESWKHTAQHLRKMTH